MNTEDVLWMLAQLSADDQHAIRRRLALRLTRRLPPAPPTTDDNAHELEPLAKMLAHLEPRRGWVFPYLARKEYDLQRGARSRTSGSLVAKYGSWVEVCRQAHRLLEHGRTTKSPQQTKQEDRRRRYTMEEAASALRECAQALGRPPSDTSYTQWRSTVRRGRRTSRRYPCSPTIFRLYRERGGWIAALEDAGLVDPPRTTVRALVKDKHQARDLVALARTAGLAASHDRRLEWIEVRGTLADVRQALAGIPTLTNTPIALWCPHTRTLDRNTADDRPNSGS